MSAGSNTPSAKDRAFQRLPVTNTTHRTLTLILEPWANEYEMPPGASFIIEGEGPPAHASFSIEYEDDLIVVWAWDGSDARILSPDGTVIADWTQIRVPIFAPRHDAPGGDDA